MNSITLQGTIISQPELRYTSNDQTPITKAQLEFIDFGQGGEEVSAYIWLQGWGKNNSETLRAVEVGQKVVITGNIRLNTVELPDGYKQKLAEVNISNLVVIN